MPLGAIPWALAADGSSDQALVVGGATVSLLDGRGGRLHGAVAAGQAPRLAAVDARTHRAFVVDTGGNRVVVLALGRALSRVATVPVGAQPTALTVDEATGRVFVVNMGSGTVSVLDATSGRLRATVRVGIQPVALAVDERRGHVYIVNSGAGGVRGSLTVMSAR